MSTFVLYPDSSASRSADFAPTLRSCLVTHSGSEDTAGNCHHNPREQGCDTDETAVIPVAHIVGGIQAWVFHSEERIPDKDPSGRQAVPNSIAKIGRLGIIFRAAGPRTSHQH